MKKYLPIIPVLLIILVGCYQLSTSIRSKVFSSLQKKQLAYRTPEIYKSAPQQPKSALLGTILTQASDTYNIPYCLLHAVAFIEGEHMFGLDNNKVKEYSDPGGIDPINCDKNAAGARGPMQFLESTFLSYSDASGRNPPNNLEGICNIYDSIFAAAKKLSINSNVTPGTIAARGATWIMTNFVQASAAYYGGCGCTPTVFTALGMSYCDYVLRACSNLLTNPNYVYCSQPMAGIAGPPSQSGPTVLSASSNVCSDFVEKRDRELRYKYDTSSPGTNSSTTQRVLISMPGTVSLQYTKFPDFSYATTMLTEYLKRTLPPEHAATFSASINLPGETTMYFKNFVQGQDEAGNFDPTTTTACDQTPEAEVNVPANLWGRMTGALRGLCTYFGYCQPVTEYVFHLPQLTYACSIGGCDPGQQAHELVLSANTRKADFSVQNYVDRTYEVEYRAKPSPAPGVLPYTVTTKDKIHKEAKILSRAQLAGGLSTAINANELFRHRLYGDVYDTVVPKDDARALTEGFNYNITFSPVDSGEHSGEYYNLRTIRNLYCMNLCTLYSADEVPEIDALCPSCDPNDPAYQDPPQPPRAPIPQPSSIPSGCNWNEASGCDYYDCTYDLRKNEGPDKCGACFCEASAGNPIVKCLTTALNLCSDISATCPGERCCTDGNNNCERKFFEPSSKFYPDNPNLPKNGPPYGRCYYANPDVCVDPKEWNENDTSTCGQVCNNSCPGC